MPQNAIREYLAEVDSIHGMYLDGVTGFSVNVDEYDRAREEVRARQPGMPLEAFDDAELIYGTGHPRQPQSRVVHACTQGEYRRRNAEGGRNHVVLGQVCLAQIYNLWDDNYRGRIAKRFGKKKEDLRSGLMGDLRNLRNPIIHHRGIADQDLDKFRYLKWYNIGEEIVLTPGHLDYLVSLLRQHLPHDVEAFVEALSPPT